LEEIEIGEGIFYFIFDVKIILGIVCQSIYLLGRLVIGDQHIAGGREF